MRESSRKLVIFCLLILMMFQSSKITDLVKCASFNMYYTLIEFFLFVLMGERTPVPSGRFAQSLLGNLPSLQ